MGVMAVAGAYKAYGQNQEGKSTNSMYQYAGDVSAQKAKQESAITTKNVELTTQTAEQNRALAMGESAEESKALDRKISTVKGAQKAGMGASGIGGVTAEDITGDTFDRATLDSMAIKYNADTKDWAMNEEMKNKIWGLREQSKRDIWALNEEEKQYRAAGSNAKKAAKRAVTNTLLETAVSMAAVYAGGAVSAGTKAGSGVSSTSRVAYVPRYA